MAARLQCLSDVWPWTRGPGPVTCNWAQLPVGPRAGLLPAWAHLWPSGTTCTTACGTVGGHALCSSWLCLSEQDWTFVLAFFLQVIIVTLCLLSIFSFGCWYCSGRLCCTQWCTCEQTVLSSRRWLSPGDLVGQWEAEGPRLQPQLTHQFVHAPLCEFPREE